jgi:hypothetical protein
MSLAKAFYLNRSNSKKEYTVSWRNMRQAKIGKVWDSQKKYYISD